MPLSLNLHHESQPGASWSTVMTMVCGFRGSVTETAMYRRPFVTSSTEFNLRFVATQASRRVQEANDWLADRPSHSSAN